MANVKRAFADLDEGQVHYWTSASPADGSRPLVLLHPGPGTARIQVPLLEQLADTRTVYAPDLMGMGDSAPPPHDESSPPDIEYYADAVRRFLDGLNVDTFDLYGSSLGGRVAMELAVSLPERVRSLMLGQVRIMKGQDLEAMAARHAPQFTPDQDGVYVQALWSRLRNLYTYFPWFMRKAANLRQTDLPPADLMHIAFIEQVKMAETAHLAFSAYYRYPVEDKLPLIKARTLVRGDGIAEMIPNGRDWDPVLKGDPLTGKPELVADFAAQLVAFMDDV